MMSALQQISFGRPRYQIVSSDRESSQPSVVDCKQTKQLSLTRGDIVESYTKVLQDQKVMGLYCDHVVLDRRTK